MTIAISSSGEIDTLADVLVSRFRHVSIREDYGWPQNSALSVIDCVLSLNQRYEGFVLPRLELFARRQPDIVELPHLSDLLTSYTEMGDFCLHELNYNHVQREQTLRGVVNFMISAQGCHEGKCEWDRLQTWAEASRPSDYVSVATAGFGLSGFQYMRMLFGAQTTKPDVHIMRFVSNVVGRTVSDVQALELLEKASAKAELPLREVDGAIWEAGARAPFTQHLAADS
jgi:hypothetical protein